MKKFRKIFLVKQKTVVYLQPASPDGEIGRHATLRGWCRLRCASSSLVLGTRKEVEKVSQPLFSYALDAYFSISYIFTISYIFMLQSVSGPFADFHVGELAVFYAEAQGGAHVVEAGDAGGTGIDGEEVVFLVVDDSEDVRMSADEDVGHMGVEQLECLVVVSAGEASDVHHQDTLALAFEKLRVGYAGTDVLPVAIAVDGFQWLELRYLFETFECRKVSCMPYLIDRSQKFLDFLAEISVCI